MAKLSTFFHMNLNSYAKNLIYSIFKINSLEFKVKQCKIQRFKNLRDQIFISYTF